MKRARAGGLLQTLRGGPLRVRLILTFSALLVFAVGTISALSLAVLRINLDNQTTNTLSSSFDSGLTVLNTQATTTDDVRELGATYNLVPVPGSFQLVVDSDGGVLVSTYLDPTALELTTLTPADVSTVMRSARSDDGPVSIRLSTGEMFRVLSVPVELADGTVTYVGGAGLAANGNTVTALFLAELVIAFVSSAIVVLAVRRTVRRALAPLEHAIDIADAVSLTPLSMGEVTQQARVALDPEDDRSEAARVAAALNRLLSHMEDSLNARHATELAMRRFIAEASHELRNPLSSIRGYADYYRAAPGLEPDLRAALDRIGDESARMTSLVEDLLTLARLDAHPILRKDQVDLSIIILEMVADAKIAHPDHQWRMRLPPEAAVVTGDENALRQILLNLLGNAGHHTSPGTTVTVVLAVAARSVRIRVHDDGAGISPADALTIFDRFTQTSTHGAGNTRNATTVGLGLAIVDALAAAAGYTVSVSSRPGDTDFIVELPI